ncbi:hypothetical protein ANCDUO_09525 [Ancylostoma duodenale]|uniref:Uncharacterized protein n=1 Tax=Ancylostoma duodenale TaxID=51022 RepID=A0A0C2GSV9_9BILA|nr:hypothetical protein ANCDUO_09525 [Ancylostoma duodenale]
MYTCQEIDQKDLNNDGLTLSTLTSSWLGSIPIRRTTGQYGVKGSTKRTPLRNGEDAQEEEDGCMMACTLGLIMISFHIISRFTSTRWVLFAATTVVWELAHDMDG